MSQLVTRNIFQPSIKSEEEEELKKLEDGKIKRLSNVKVNFVEFTTFKDSIANVFLVIETENYKRQYNFLNKYREGLHRIYLNENFRFFKAYIVYYNDGSFEYERLYQCSINYTFKSNRINPRLKISDLIKIGR